MVLARKIKFSKGLLTIIGVLLFFSLFGYWKFGNALIEPEMSFTRSGDGIGWIGLIHAVGEKADERGLGVLFGDTFWSEKLGFNLTAPYPLNAFWKWNFWLFSNFFSAQDVYDINALLAFVLIGVFGFLLLRELDISFFFSFVGAILLTNMDHFMRFHGHIVGVGSYYAPILLTWGAVRVGKNPTLLRCIIFSVLNVLNFMVFEYYGYFGIFFSFTLLFCYFLKSFRKSTFFPGKIAINVAVAGLVFVLLMNLAYPNLVLKKLLAFFASQEGSALATHNAGHSWGTFLYYSVRKPLALFDTSLPWLHNLGGDIFKNDLGEFTFRIGLILPLFTLFAMCFWLCKALLGKSREEKELLLESLCWFPPMILMVLFSLNPQCFLSLVPFTFKFAPMFRVAARAFIYIDIGLIVLFVFAANNLVLVAIAGFRNSRSIQRRLLRGCAAVAVLVMTIFGIADVSKGRVFEQAKDFKLPDTGIYQCLAERKAGLVLELPAYSPITDDASDTYIYFYNRTRHGFPIANMWYPPPSNVEFRQHLHRLSAYFNSKSPEIVLDLKKGGVRYVVVDKTKMEDSVFRKSSHVELIADSPSKSIFEMKVDKDVPNEEFIEYFVYPEPTLLFKSGFGREQRKQNVYWRWAGKRGEILLKNHSRNDMNIEFSAFFCAPVGSSLEVKAPFFKDNLKMTTPRVQYGKSMALKANSEIIIAVASNASPNSGTKPDLVFYIFNYAVKVSE